MPKTPRSQERHSFLLYDYHGEYLHQLYDHKWRPGFARCFILVDFNYLDDWKIEVDLTEAPAHIRDALGTWNDGAEILGGSLIGVYGKLEDHRSLFLEMAVELLEGPQGGDDDTFDYWPGACETLEMYASLLAEVDPKKRPYAKAIQDLNSKFLGNVPEWEGVQLR